MKLLLVRHADAMSAADANAQGVDDSDRPLTQRGRIQLDGFKPNLVALVPELDVILHSPLLRAAQTAESLHQSWPDARRDVCMALRSIDDPDDLAMQVVTTGSSTVALVGHEPSLSTFAAWLLTGQPVPIFALAKGGACLISTRGAPAGGTGKLRWLI